MTVSGLRISMDFTQQRLRDDPASGHNRWHEAIGPALTVDSGSEVVLDLRDGFDGQVTPGAPPESLSDLDLTASHPMTGPIEVDGARPGDAIEVEILDIEPDPFGHYGFTAIIPGFGLLSDHFTNPYVVHWQLHGREYAESEQLPGVRVPCAPFVGLIGTAPDRAFRERVIRREATLAGTGAIVNQPEAAGAIPDEPSIAASALRTIPPRENGGNLDTRQLRPGTKLLLPAYVPGGRVSLGDTHYAQGDGESCGSAIEMRARVTVRLTVRRGVAEAGLLPWPVFTMSQGGPQPTGPTLGTVGLCVENGTNYSRDLTVAARQAVLSMVSMVAATGFSPEQAYVIVSVAADLHVGQVVDAPNVGVSALLPLSVFSDGGKRVLDLVKGSHAHVFDS